MPNDQNQYENPLISRYASAAMSELWSPQRKFSTWRRLWVALAEAEAELGLPITAGADRRAAGSTSTTSTSRRPPRYERRLRHDVMAHVHAYGDACPEARPIIHLGATSCYVTDNTDLLLMREALELVRDRLVAVIDALAALRPQAPRSALPGLHPLPAGPADHRGQAGLPLGLRPRARPGRDRAPPGPASRPTARRAPPARRPASWSLFDGDHDKVRRLEELICRKMGFADSYPVTGQTYSAQDRRAGAGRASRALPRAPQDGHRPAAAGPSQGDRGAVRGGAGRLLGHGLQAQPDAERADLLAGPVRHEPGVQRGRRPPPMQWLERTLDDSANRRLVLPQAFLATDAVLILCQNVAGGLVVYPRVIAASLEAELPFMATENILMAAWRPAATGRTCTSGSAATARPRPRWSRSRAGGTTSWSGWPPTRPSPRSIWRRRWTRGSSSAVRRSRSTSSWPRWSSRSYPRYPDAARSDAEVRV